MFVRDAGNNLGLSCDGTPYLRRDAVDSRVLRETGTLSTQGSGRLVDAPLDPVRQQRYTATELSRIDADGWPIYRNGTRCTDADRDGMPDAFEKRQGLDPSSADGAADADGDGFTNLEEYLNATDPNSADCQ